MIKIFDSLTHPTLDGTWLNSKFDQYSSLDYLINAMEQNNIYKAFAVGLKDVGAYDEAQFIDYLQPHEKLIPIAFCEHASQLTSIKALGYKGIKIHPRISKISGHEDFVIDIIKKANDLNLIVLFCGFLGCHSDFIQKIGHARMIYLHCGGKEFANTWELLIEKDNILLDLSYTMCTFQELFTEIQITLEKYPHKFCIGSDHPEVSHKVLRSTFEKLTTNITLKNKELIAFRNIENFYNQTLKIT